MPFENRTRDVPRLLEERVVYRQPGRSESPIKAHVQGLGRGRPASASSDAAAVKRPRILFSEFQVEALLRAHEGGSMYLVRRHRDGKPYTLKERDVNKLSQVQLREAVNEIRLLARISHPNVIRHHEAFHDSNWLCWIMEYASQGTLNDLIRSADRRKTPLSEGAIWRIFAQMALGVDALHAERIVHGDIKPSTVFISGQNVIKIGRGELGVAKPMEHSAVTNTLKWTTHSETQFMAPEVMLGAPYTLAADMWSLGATLFNMMTFEEPFSRRLRDRVLSGEITMNAFHEHLPKEMMSPYSADLQKLCRELLNGSPLTRPSISRVLSVPAVAAQAKTFQAQRGTGVEAAD